MNSLPHIDSINVTVEAPSAEAQVTVEEVTFGTLLDQYDTALASVGHADVAINDNWIPSTLFDACCVILSHVELPSATRAARDIIREHFSPVHGGHGPIAWDEQDAINRAEEEHGHRVADDRIAIRFSNITSWIESNPAETSLPLGLVPDAVEMFEMTEDWQGCDIGRECADGRLGSFRACAYRDEGNDIESFVIYRG